MTSRSPAEIRNIALCGHANCGKTTLVESLLLKGGALPRKGSIDEGNTTSDFDPLEKHHKHSVDLTCTRLELKNATLHLLDTPGYRDFCGQVYSALSVVEAVALVIDADEGVRPYTRKLWELIESFHLPCFIVINRVDREQAKLAQTLSQIQEAFGSHCVPVVLPHGEGAGFTAVEAVFGGSSDAAKKGYAQLVEAVVESDDALMERYLGGESLSEAEVRAQMKKAIEARDLFPLFYTSGVTDVGVAELLELLTEMAPSAERGLGRVFKDGDVEKPLATSIDAPLCAFVFKVVSDPYVGKLTYLRIFSGSLATTPQFLNPHSRKHDKVGKVVHLQGKEHPPVEAAGAGDIVALLKIEGLKAFDTLSQDGHFHIAAPKLPAPMYGRAVEPKSKADEKKFAEGIVKVVDEDVMVSSVRDDRTHEMVVSGVSPLHLHILWERLKARYGVEVIVKEPKTPYLETIVGKAEDHYRHKKQSGGAGEFAEVWLRVAPKGRGEGVEFVNSVFGGAISASYVASAEKGIRAVLERGVIAGYPVVDLTVDIFDGKEHPVDSKDVAFQKAGREAFKLAVRKAKPVLLEPIVTLEVSFPLECMGDIQGDLNRRRARVTGADSNGNFQTLKAHVPLAALSDYASTLGSMTAGQGSYGIEMSHYDFVPANIQQGVCDAAKAEMEKEDA